MAALSLRRSFMNVVRNYSEVEIKVREATCNDPWCPPSMLMAEISDMTYKACHLAEVMKVIWKRLGEKGRNWRHVYKSLILLEYLLKTGSENVYNQCKAKTLTLKQLQDFFFIDGKGQDQVIISWINDFFYRKAFYLYIQLIFWYIVKFDFCEILNTQIAVTSFCYYRLYVLFLYIRICMHNCRWLYIL